jgi:hypothetical protein
VSTIKATKPSFPTTLILPFATAVYALTSKSCDYFLGLTQRSGWECELAKIAPFIKTARNPEFIDLRRSGKADHENNDGVEELAHRKNRVNKTPMGRGLTSSTLSRLSDADPHVTLTKGMDEIFFNLFGSHNLDDYECISPTTPGTSSLAARNAYWGIDNWRVQISPKNLLELVTSLDAIPIDLFSDLADAYSKTDAARLAWAFSRTEEAAKQTKLHRGIAFANLPNFNKCLRNFCLTIDGVFNFSSTFRSSLLGAIKRTVEVAGRYIQAPNTPITTDLLWYCADHFQTTIHQLYASIVGGVSTDNLGIVNMIKRIPAINQESQFMLGIRTIQLRHSSTQTFPLPPDNACTPSDPNLRGKKKKKTETPTTLAAPTPPPSPSLKSKICCFFNSTDGCKKTAKDCSRMHRDAKDAADEKELDSFFKRNTYLTKK